jgi:ATP-dependent Clp protease adaptor protein ClpS
VPYHENGRTKTFGVFLKIPGESAMPVEKHDRQRDTAVMQRPKTAPPPMFNVILHNDDFTTKIFVVHVLVSVFRKSPEQAHDLMMHIHRNGHGVAGTYPYEVAETKTKIVTSMAEEAGFPLKATIAPD